jgi:hypothetical protein
MGAHDKQALALADRERKIELMLVKQRAGRMVAEAKEQGKLALEKGKKLAVAASEVSATMPIFDAAVEFGGMVLESTVKKKLSSTVHDYLPVGAVAVEAICLYEIITGKHKAGTLEALRLGASAARGARMRSTLGMADNLVDKIFG